MSRIEIRVPESQGKAFLSQGATVSIDGEKIENTYSIDISLDAGDITKLTVKYFVKAGEGYLLEPTREGSRGVVRESKTFSFSGSIAVEGVLIAADRWAE